MHIHRQQQLMRKEAIDLKNSKAGTNERVHSKVREGGNALIVLLSQKKETKN